MAGCRTRGLARSSRAWPSPGRRPEPESSVAVLEHTSEGFRLSPQQRLLWRLNGEARAFRVECAVRIDGPLDLAALQAAVRAVVARHEILRTVYPCPPGM